MSRNRGVQYLDTKGNVVSEDEAFEDGTRILKSGYLLRRPLMLLDSEPDEAQPVLDALRSNDADRIDWGRLEANRLAARERGRGNLQGARMFESARDAAAERRRAFAPEKGSSEEARAQMKRDLENSWKNGDAA
jgi:hypothetical protein